MRNAIGFYRKVIKVLNLYHIEFTSLPVAYNSFFHLSGAIRHAFHTWECIYQICRLLKKEQQTTHRTDC